MQAAAVQVISTILKHDRKTNSYKIALLRAINDVALAFPDVGQAGHNIAIPLRLLAQHWVACYWPFMDAATPIWQGQRASDPRTKALRNDVSFRPHLTTLRRQWEDIVGDAARPTDGFFLVNELRLPRKQATYPPALRQAYQEAIKAITTAITYPIRYAGPGEWTVFARPRPYKALPAQTTIAIPGTTSRDLCLVVSHELWEAFRRLSLWVEALCIHEWSLFTEKANSAADLGRGMAYTLLTDRPGSRRPLTWERNRIDLLIMEGEQFTCPWTEKKIRQGVNYDLDHLLPLAVYPTNELWNLAPSDPDFNSYQKRDRLPSPRRIQAARPHLAHAYGLYTRQPDLAQAFREDVALRFVRVEAEAGDYPQAVAQAVSSLLAQIADTRNVARF